MAVPAVRPNHRDAQHRRVRPAADALAERLRESVRVRGIEGLIDAVAAARTPEDAVGARVYNVLRGIETARQMDGKQGIREEERRGVVAPLFRQSQAIHDDSGIGSAGGLHETVRGLSGIPVVQCHDFVSGLRRAPCDDVTEHAAMSEHEQPPLAH